jgi:hypothetical protein
MIPTNDDSQPAFLLQVQDKKLVPIMIGTKKVADFVVPALPSRRKDRRGRKRLIKV